MHLRKSIILHGCVLGFHIAVPAEEELSSYHDNVKELAEAERMDNPSRHTVKTTKKLFKVTFDGRRKWIREDVPSVVEVLKVFPSLKNPARVCSHNFKFLSSLLVCVLFAATERAYTDSCT